MKRFSKLLTIIMATSLLYTETLGMSLAHTTYLEISNFIYIRDGVEMEDVIFPMPYYSDKKNDAYIPLDMALKLFDINIKEISTKCGEYHVELSTGSTLIKIIDIEVKDGEICIPLENSAKLLDSLRTEKYSTKVTVNKDTRLITIKIINRSDILWKRNF